MKKFALLAIAVMSILQAAAKEIEFKFPSSYDKSEQSAAGYVPSTYSGKQALPLLVIAHYYSGNRFTAKKLGYYDQAEKRNMLVVCPELHGVRSPGTKSLAALPAQHDILDAIEYMKKNYHVDESRIYLAGRSMGGQMAMLLGAKQAMLFAAVVAGQGVSDLAEFYETTTPQLRTGIIGEMGAPPNKDNMFEYRRRSAINYAPNLKYVPLIMWHGTNDTWVIPEMSKNLFERAKKYNPFQQEVYWLQGAAHCPANYTSEWVCDKLKYYQNAAEAGMGLKRRFFSDLNFVTDENTDFFWLSVKLKKHNEFCRINAEIKDGVLTASTINAAALTVDMDKLASTCSLSECRISADNELTFTVISKGKVITKATGRKLDLKLEAQKSE